MSHIREAEKLKGDFSQSQASASASSSEGRTAAQKANSANFEFTQLQDAQAKGGHGRRHKVLSTCSTGAIGPYLNAPERPIMVPDFGEDAEKKEA